MGEATYRLIFLEGGLVLRDGCATDQVHGVDILEVLGEALKLLVDLESQLASVHDHNNGGSVVLRLGLQKMQHGENKHGGLAHAGLCLANNITTKNGLRNAFMLDCHP